MIEDKLSRDERIALECLAQANMTVASARAGLDVGHAATRVLTIQAQYEARVRGTDRAAVQE